MPDNDDPRVYFAAERTLLAWIRTGLATIGLGFVVARFGLFLRTLGAGETPAQASHTGSTLIGVGLVLLGSAAMGLAARQHVQYCRGLAAGSLPRPRVLGWPIWFSIILAVIGVILAAYLLVRSNIG
jgi:putative membrane protein